jgi:hypothetical protein
MVGFCFGRTTHIMFGKLKPEITRLNQPAACCLQFVLTEPAR